MILQKDVKGLIGNNFASCCTILTCNIRHIFLGMLSCICFCQNVCCVSHIKLSMTTKMHSSVLNGNFSYATRNVEVEHVSCMLSNK